MLFGITAFLVSVLLVIVLGCLLISQSNLIPFYKISLLSFTYFWFQLLPYVCEIQNQAPFIFDTVWFIFSSWLYMILPLSLITYYQYFISIIGPLYIFIETAQVIGLSIIFSETIAQWIEDEDEDEDEDEINDSGNEYKETIVENERRTIPIMCRKILIVSFVLCVYSFSLYFIFHVYNDMNVSNLPLTMNSVIICVLCSWLLITVSSIIASSGNIIQTAMISLYFCYILYLISQLNIIKNDSNMGDNHYSKNTVLDIFYKLFYSRTTSLANEAIDILKFYFVYGLKHYLLECGVVLLILLSIPLSLSFSENKGEKTLNTNNKSTRLQSFVFAIVVLLLTHVFQVWNSTIIGSDGEESRNLAITLFWYRFSEIFIATFIYLWFLIKQSVTKLE